MRFELIRCGLLKQKWRFRLVAENGRAVVWSEHYANRKDALHAIELIRNTGPLTRIIDPAGNILG